jgi:hypothetical protein
VFSGAFIARAFFDIDDRSRDAARGDDRKAARARRREEADAHVRQGHAALARGDAESALRKAAEADEAYGDTDYPPARLLRARSLLALERYADLEPSIRNIYSHDRPRPMADEDFTREFVRHLRAADASGRIYLLMLLQKRSPPREEAAPYVDALGDLVRSDNRAVALQALHVAATWSMIGRTEQTQRERLKTLLREVAQGPDSALSAAARTYLRRAEDRHR